MINKDLIIENLQEEIYDLEKKIEDLKCDKDYLTEIKKEYDVLKREVLRPRCFYCGSPLIWGADFSFEDYGIDGEGIVSTHSCSGCNVTVEFYCPCENDIELN